MGRRLGRPIMRRRLDDERYEPPRQRQRAGLTQQQLADRMNVGRDYISKLESGKSRYNVDLIGAAAEALGIEAPDLLRRPGKEEPLLAIVRQMSQSERERALKVLEAIRDSAA